LLAAALFLLPFVLAIHRPPIPAFQQELGSAVLLGLALLFLAPQQSHRYVQLRWPILVFIMGLTAMAAWHWFAGHFAYSYSLTSFWMAICLMLCAYCLGRWCADHDAMPQLVGLVGLALAVGAVINAAVQWAQVFGVTNLPGWLYFEMPRNPEAGPFRPVGNIGQANQVATYLAMGIACLALSPAKARPFGAVVRSMALLACASGIALSGSRMGLLMICGIGVLLIVLAASGRMAPRAAGLSFAAMAVGYFVGLVGGPAAFGAVETVSSRIGQSTYGFRSVMWRDALGVVAAHPLAGVGVGEYGRAQYWVAERSPFTQGTPLVHNVVLQVAVESGVLLAMALAVLFGWWCLGRFPQRFDQPHQRLIWVLVALVMFHAMLEWPLHVMTFAIPAALLWGLGEPSTERRCLNVDAGKVLPPLAAAFLLYSPLMLEDYRRIAQATEGLVGTSDAFQAVLEVVTLGNQTYFKPHAERNLLRVARPSRPVDANQIAMAERVLARQPDAGLIAHYILLLALSDQPQKAIPHVERMRVFALSDEQFEQLRSRILERLQQEGDGMELLRRALVEIH
jgi:O-antigen ligase